MTSIERVIITGASSALGLDIAQRFLAESARVLVNSAADDLDAFYRTNLRAVSS